MTTKVKIDQILTESVQFSHRADYFTLGPEGSTEGRAEFQATFIVADDQPLAIVKLRAKSVPPEGPEPAGYTFDVVVVAMLQVVDGDAKTEQGEREVLSIGINLLIPFMREQVASLTLRGRFGPIWLQPIHVSQILGSLTKVSDERFKLERKP